MSQADEIVHWFGLRSGREVHPFWIGCVVVFQLVMRLSDSPVSATNAIRFWYEFFVFDDVDVDVLSERSTPLMMVLKENELLMRWYVVRYVPFIVKRRITIDSPR